MALIPWSFHFETKQLEKLRELSKRTRVPQSAFIREGLDYVLKKYGYLLTMTPFTPEKALAHLLGSRHEEILEGWAKKTGLPRFEVESYLLRKLIRPKEPGGLGKVIDEWKPRKKRRSWQSLLMDSAKRAIEESDTKMRLAKLEIESGEDSQK